MLTLLCDFSSVMTTIWHVLLAFIILMIMVLIHETGHYAAGKALGFQINEFSIGMGPRIFSKKKKNGEVFSLRALPLGGFCAFEGENEDGTDNPASFNSQKPWKRLIVLFSGAFFNFVSAIIIGIIAFGCYGDNVAYVKKVYDYAPVANRQLQQGDILYKINGKRVFILDDISRYMDTDKEMTFVVLRPTTDDSGAVTYREEELKGLTRNVFSSCQITKTDGDIISQEGDRKLTVGDTVYKLNGEPLGGKGKFAEIISDSAGECRLTVLGSDAVEYDYVIDKTLFDNGAVTVTDVEYKGIGMIVSYAAYRFDFGESVARTFPYCGEVAMLVLRTLGGLLTGVVGVEQVGGPITTISMTSQIVATGFANVLRLIVLISVNLAVFNLLPVPALDGCQMVFVIIEWIARRPINRKVQSYINGIGLILLIILMVLIDLLKL
ncbi:MAG: RIP metalloprotease RseP [Corallococcus sp.]|nr:RIP metalloprotease RseP [Bacillota bacterium]MCM1534132.1 RIP metalloprotease RseP [Corallococcus sp.]